MTEEQITQHKAQIDGMSQMEMASLWRYAPSGHPYFDKRLPRYEHFKERFKGFTPEISKALG